MITININIKYEDVIKINNYFSKLTTSNRKTVGRNDMKFDMRSIDLSKSILIHDQENKF